MKEKPKFPASLIVMWVLVFTVVLLFILVLILLLGNFYCASEYGSLSESYMENLGRPRIEIYNQTINFVFKRTDGGLEYWSTPFSTLEDSIRLGFLVREIYSSTSSSYIYLKSENRTVRAMDFSKFITPEPFEVFSKTLYEKSSSDYDFIHEIWFFITQMTTYSSEIEETPKYPQETLFSGGGDCEDLAILFASIIKAAPTDWKLSLIYLDADNPEYSKVANHVIVKIQTGDNQTYLVDPTSTAVMSPFDNVNGWELVLE